MRRWAPQRCIVCSSSRNPRYRLDCRIHRRRGAATAARFDHHDLLYQPAVGACNWEIHVLLREGKIAAARELFDAMPLKTTVSWNTMLAGYSRRLGKLQDAVELFSRIPCPDVVSYNSMLSCHLLNSDLHGARELFAAMPLKDAVSWNTMISGLSDNGLLHEAREVFEEMPQRNPASWNALVSGCIRAGDLRSAEAYFARAPNAGDIILLTAMISGYMKFGRTRCARELFDEMRERNTVTWNAMIAGYVENGMPEEGVRLFRTMTGSTAAAVDVKPSSSTLSSVLLACSNLSSLHLGRQVHQWASKSPLGLTPTVSTSLVSMYCKCGDLGDARALFGNMHSRDAVAWNAIISGYAQHGHGAEALWLFEEMVQQHEATPNSITFIAVLTACNHTGLLEMAMRLFHSMTSDYGIAPAPEHYSCMVDLLCRAGLLAEAVELVGKMPFEPHPAAYGALLGACRKSKASSAGEIAEFAAGKLLELSPHSAGACVQLANVYASASRWMDVSRVRRWMKENRVVKMPGYSWIELRGSVHTFRSGDRCHPQLRRIHDKLDGLKERMEREGYNSVLDSALLHEDAGEEVKEKQLWRHSEKLAIAWGLISIPMETDGGVLRVFMNLRVCDDCHNAAKFISVIEGRVIILRDNSRFHRFSNGSCSCADYW